MMIVVQTLSGRNCFVPPLNILQKLEVKKDLSFHKKNNNKRRVILVDDDKDILFTYESFLKGYDYDIISFTDS